MAIPLTVPSVIRVYADAPAAGSYLEAIHRAISTAGTHWEVLRYVPDGGLVLGQKDVSATQRVWVRYISNGVLHVNLDPNGRTHDPSLELTNAVTDFVNFSGIQAAASSAVSHSCWFLTTSIVGLDLTDLATRMDIIETDDCLTMFIYGDSTNSFTWGSPVSTNRNFGNQTDLWFAGVQIGKIFQPDNPLESPLGIDGSGIVTGWPGITPADSDRLSWLAPVSRGSLFQNAVRTGLNSWTNFYAPNCENGLSIANDTTWRPVDGKVRPIPVTIAMNSGQILGRSKYFRLSNREVTAPTVYNVDNAIVDGNHQAWIQRQYLVDSTGTYTTKSNTIHLWTESPVVEV
jgi:hypothetical protein